MASCVQEVVYIQGTPSYWEGTKKLLKPVFTTKLKTAGKIALKQVIVLGLHSARLGPKNQRCGPVKTVAPASKSAFRICQIGQNIDSLISKREGKTNKLTNPKEPTPKQTNTESPKHNRFVTHPVTSQSSSSRDSLCLSSWEANRKLQQLLNIQI